MARTRRVSEMSGLMALCAAKFPTCIQQINYPMHQGRPNPSHGKFYFVGSIPAACYDADQQRSKQYATEQDAINAAFEAGAEAIQGVDCRFVKPWGKS